ncbi:MAG: hypothetical protein NC081_07115 [Roseburia sp.]|nr:hypothetical protein [Roseburia sp.]
MLGKLIKYEWKDVYKIGLLMLSIIFGVTLIGVLYFHTPLWNQLFSNQVNENSFAILTGAMSGVGSLLLYVFMLVGVSYGIMIYIGVHFYRTMYTDQGYLTQTLPVKSGQLLISKLFVGGIWVILVELAIIASVIALGGGMVSGFMVEYGMDWDLRALFRELYWAFEEEMGIGFFRYLVSMILTLVIGPFMGMSVLFGAITIGQLSGKHKGMMGIVAYFVLAFVNSLLSMLVSVMITFGSVAMRTVVSEEYYTYNSTYDASLITSVVMGVVMFFVAQYILKNKLNMD